MTDVLAEMMYLYRGREDIYGALHGECIRGNVTKELWRDHLYGDGSLGIYPLTRTASGPRVAWGASDIDDGDECLPLAKNLHKTLKLLGITSWVERSKSRGYHVLVFVQGWCPADAMRNALLFAHQVAGVTPTEVNPKSIHGGKAGNGNYLHAAYSKQYADQGRRVVLDPDTWEPLPLTEFVGRSMASLNTVQDILKVAERYVPPPPPKRIDIEEYVGSVDKKLTDKLSPIAWTVFVGPPLEGRDRSGTLARLAHLMAEHAIDKKLTPPEALALLCDADLRWGKFIESGRPEELDKMISAAWNKAGLL